MRKAFWIVSFIVVCLACLIVSSERSSAKTTYYRRPASKNVVSSVPYFNYDIFEKVTGYNEYAGFRWTETNYQGKMYDYWFLDQHFFKKRIKVVFADPIYCYYPNGVTVKYDGRKRWIFYKDSTTFSKAIM